MDFTRQPIIETVITAKEGCKLVIRSSKGTAAEEYFVDAIEVVSFGNTFFFRSQEKPKSFLVPATDYEVLEVREARMVLKSVGMNRAIKIGGGKEKSTKETPKVQEKQPKEEELEKESSRTSSRQSERKRDRRRSFRRRKRGDELVGDKDLDDSDEIIEEVGRASEDEDVVPIQLPEPKGDRRRKNREDVELSAAVLQTLLPPPPNLISETIEKYKENKLFEGVFLNKPAKQAAETPSEIFLEEEEEVSSTDVESGLSETIDDVEAVLEESISIQEEDVQDFSFCEVEENREVDANQRFQQSEDPLVENVTSSECQESVLPVDENAEEEQKSTTNSDHC